jgi:hypothetical protein
VSEESSLPVVDEQRVCSIFSELEGMEIELDPDPLLYGPRRLNKKVASTRGMLTRCERVFLQTSHDLQIYKTAHRAAQLDFDLQMQDLIANDPEVRAGSNVRDRDAIATMKLREDRQNLIGMEVAIGDLEMVMTVIKAKRADLRDIQGRIRDQIKLCQEEIGLGGKWRSIPAPGEEAPDLDNAPHTDQKALASIQDLVEEAGGQEVDEVHLTEGDGEWMEGEGNDADVDEVLAAVAEADEEAPANEDGTDPLEGSEEGEDDSEIAPPDEPEEQPAEEPAEDPKPDKVDADTDEEVDMDELFKDGGEGDGGEPIPPVDSDSEVDDIFDRVEAAAPPEKKPEKAAPAADEDLDLDNLIDMFGDES